jgi:hypothetical protein
MNGRLKVAAGVAIAAMATGAGAVAVAGGGDSIREELSGYEEVPAVSTPATGKFRAHVWAGPGEIRYKLRYADLEGEVTQAHIHLGQRHVNGGVSAFLCTNIGGAPPETAGAQPCPPAPAEVSGTLTAADVIGPEDQGIAPGEFDELVRAIEAGVTYVNVHSSKFPGGEIRAQLENGEHDDDD